MEDYAREKIKNGVYTATQIAKKPCLVLLNSNEKLCPTCNQIKKVDHFPHNKRMCNKCREQGRKDAKEEYKKNIETEIIDFENNFRNIKEKEEQMNFLNTYTRDKMYIICQHFNVTRRSSDKKEQMIEKLYNFLTK